MMAKAFVGSMALALALRLIEHSGGNCPLPSFFAMLSQQQITTPLHGATPTLTPSRGWRSFMDLEAAKQVTAAADAQLEASRRLQSMADGDGGDEGYRQEVASCLDEWLTLAIAPFGQEQKKKKKGKGKGKDK
jgi:hypothetical protein